MKIIVTLCLVLGFNTMICFGGNSKVVQRNSNYYYKNGLLVKEKTEAFFGIHFLYKNPVGSLVRKVLNRKWASASYGWFSNTWMSRVNIKRYIKKYNIDMNQFQGARDSYKTFNEFFMRKLKPNARLVNSDSKIVTSPADSKLLVVPEITKDMCFFVKDKPFNIETFMQNKELAQGYQGGSLLVFRLAPYDYHRYHFPLDCVPSVVKKISGTYDSVNPFVFKSGLQPLQTNKRHITVLKTKDCLDVTMVAVGAMMVGKIIETYKPFTECKKGAEAGYFAVGGSTVVLFFKKGIIKIDDTLIKNSREGFETAVKMGESVAQRINS